MPNQVESKNPGAAVLAPALSHAAQPEIQLTSSEVAQRLDKSVAWVKKHARELGGHLHGGVWQFPSFEIERRKTTVESIAFRGSPRAPDPEVGRRTAAVVRMLEDRAQCSAIVLALEEPYDFVQKVRAQWIEGYRADARDIEVRCGCGAPSDPSTARCAKCHVRSRVLRDEQIAILAAATLEK